MSHELRTPLNAVLGFAQVLEMDPSAPLAGMQKECVYEIMTAGNHLLELINEVLDLARIEAGKARLSIEPVSINTIIEETMTLIIPTGEKYGINVYADACNCQNGYVKADKTKLKQVLVNLLSNAVKYNKPNGKVEFWCETDTATVRFHVVDTGIGIPADEIEAIFKPFYRLNNTKNIIEGTGVGLALVRQLTEMMGGTVTAESTDGEGSHFCVELPAAEEMTLWSEREEMAAKTAAGSVGGPAEKKILYIEDNQANLRLVERVFGLIPGAVFMSSPSAELGIQKARLERPNVILLDINLPGMDGYEAFLKLRGYDETKDIPIIAVTSNAMEREIERAMGMGFYDYITKPIRTDLFIERIKRVFDREKQ
jgi:CheY-like chemotaxis protein/anti-sigma regulatory factor (Ser/Thr protein kinase)